MTCRPTPAGLTGPVLPVTLPFPLPWRSSVTVGSLRLSRMNPGGSDPLPLRCFRLWDQRFTVKGHLRWPVHRQSLGYGGTGAVTTPASPATVVDRPHSVPVPRPAAFRADLAAVCRLIAMAALRARLAGV